MTKGDDILDELETLLAAVEPSTSFATRVRTAIEQPSPARPWALTLGWASAAAAGTLVVGWTLWGPGPAGRRAGPLVSAPTVATHQADRQSPGAMSAPPLAVEARRRGVPSGRESVEPIEPTDPIQTADGRLLVPMDQQIAVVRLLRRLGRGGAGAPAGSGLAFAPDGLLLPPAPLIVAPLPDLATDDINDPDRLPAGPRSRKDPR